MNAKVGISKAVGNGTIELQHNGNIPGRQRGVGHTPAYALSPASSLARTYSTRTKGSYLMLSISLYLGNGHISSSTISSNLSIW